MRSRLAAALPLLLILGCDDGDNEASTATDASTGANPGETAPASTTATDTTGAASTSEATTAGPTTAATSTTDPTTTTATTATTDPTTGADTGNAETGSSTGEDMGEQNPPMGAAMLVPWLEAGEYTKWQSESAVHDSDGPHFGDVRTYMNTALFDSLTDGAATHPASAAVVKEMYGDGAEVRGWSVMVKTEAGAGGDTWYWLEIFDGTTYADGVGDGQCVDCHSEGQDHVRTPFPLQ